MYQKTQNLTCATDNSKTLVLNQTFSLSEFTYQEVLFGRN